jgi:hypothetical protein
MNTDAIWRKIRTLKLVKGEVKGLRRSDLLNGNMKNVSLINQMKRMSVALHFVYSLGI